MKKSNISRIGSSIVLTYRRVLMLIDECFLLALTGAVVRCQRIVQLTPSTCSSH